MRCDRRQAANRIFAGGTHPHPISERAPHPCFGEQCRDGPPWLADQFAAATSVRTFAQGIGGSGLTLAAFLKGFSADAECFASCFQADFSPIKRCPLRHSDRMRRVVARDMGLVSFRYVGYAVVAGDP